ncbi:MAG: polysaccharide deacetylase family protein [Deltaproteobacteria bacterium]|nr:polysaccharide deacetylase family protein [Deltaproteobacteria bacterium]
MSLRLASISVDLDEVPLYAAIHGLAIPHGPSAHAAYDRCVPRLTEWLDDESIRATFFAIGKDLERDENCETISALQLAGHEVANHSYHHRYDLTRRTPAEIQEDVERGADAIERACGKRPIGFRAPGYTVTDALFNALDRAGVGYDSSVFPCPSYYAAKVATLAGIRLRFGHPIRPTRAERAVPGREAVLATGKRLVGAPHRRHPAATPVHRHLAGARRRENRRKTHTADAWPGADQPRASRHRCRRRDRGRACNPCAAPRGPETNGGRQARLASRGDRGDPRRRLRARDARGSSPTHQGPTHPVDSRLCTARTASSSACSLSRTP